MERKVNVKLCNFLEGYGMECDRVCTLGGNLEDVPFVRESGKCYWHDTTLITRSDSLLGRRVVNCE